MRHFLISRNALSSLLGPIVAALLLAGLSEAALAQRFLESTPSSKRWADSVLNKLSRKQKIAQLMVIRLSERKGSGVAFYEEQVAKYLKKYNVGSVCLFQGTPYQQAEVLNRLQSKARTPLLVCVDGETGVGMRFAGVVPFPDQLTIGAVQNAEIAYKVGRAIAEQCKRIGIQVDYAPVVDVNNNPANPVINFRSFGEDKYKVAALGTQIMRGMQDGGIMACAKHFPGHGDVSVDSHLDLPVINKSIAQLDSLELYPFRQLVNEGVGSVMVAHLYIPSIDSTHNRATSLSPRNVSWLLRNQIGFKGLTFTDALEMKGVAKFYPQGEAAVQSLIAGNDMLCLPGDVKGSIKKVRRAVRKNRLSWKDIDEKVYRVLLAKHNLGLASVATIDTTSLLKDLNAQSAGIKKEVYENALTLLRNENPGLFPLTRGRKVAYVGIGIDSANHLSGLLRNEWNADTYFFGNTAGNEQADSLLKKIGQQYDVVITGLHHYKKYPGSNFGISSASLSLLRELSRRTNVVTCVFGNPYAISNITDASNLLACYEDDTLMHEVVFDWLAGKLSARGKLPVTVSPAFHYGSGIIRNAYFPVVQPSVVGLNEKVLNQIDSVALDAIAKQATPGCVVLVAKDGKVAFNRAYGHMNYDAKEPVTLESIYDLASVTKISATTMSVMKLYEEGKLDLDKTLGDYLPWVAGSDKAGLKLRDVLLHQAGLVSFIPFYRETIDASGKPKPGFYQSAPSDAYPVRVAENMYMRKDWTDTLYKRILQSKLGPADKYVYSDNDFIFLGKVVEQISGMSLHDYARLSFYKPLHMSSTGFKPREHVPLSLVVPTENEKYFRLQQIRGDVHDPGAAMFGGVAGHAGLFSNAYDLAQLYQMLLNGGELNGVRIFKKKRLIFLLPTAVRSAGED
ncbi:glycoside hydrolase family 3 N-terminal domain-containing protein [Arcticibacter sp. MXS-1]|uniref:glycoside hydrolase family 3 N-terminal domain-containing protein n=1 Tax=Arcticibacter sp. MXS-1 TaxID=3341726 RepID=UPI0035A9A618